MAVVKQKARLILTAKTLVEFPGKRRLELWIARRSTVQRAIDWLRRKAGRPPLRYPEKTAQ